MRRNLSLLSAGSSVSAILAIPYVLIVLACLFLVGIGTDGSLQATLLGIGWNYITGFEIGLLGVVIVGFAISGAFVPAFNAVQRRLASQSGTSSRPSQPGSLSVPHWAIRLLIACLVLPALTLIVLHMLAPVIFSGSAPGIAGANARSPGMQAQPINLGSTFNTAVREAEPSFTADGRTMYFNCNNTDICVSHLVGTKQGGNWTSPELLGPTINTEYEEVEPVINGAGDMLYFTSIQPPGLLNHIPFLSPVMNVFQVANALARAKSGRSIFGGLGLEDVWVSYRINGVWSKPQNINNIAGEPHINTPFADDHCLFFSADGNEAFWTSNRPGGFGDNDIWTVRRVDGQWTEPENMGANINGLGAEHTSIPTPDGLSLYVTSNRPGGFGGDDIYVARRATDGKWGPLVNLGPQINGQGDDRCPAWTLDLKIFLFDSVRPGGFGGRDIWWVSLEEVIGHPLAVESSSAEAPSSAYNLK